MKLIEKEKAQALRRRGFSLREISESLGVSKSSVSLWVRHEELDEKAKTVLETKLSNGQRAASKAHRDATLKKLKLASEFSHRVIKDVSSTLPNIRVLCSMIYWCEGAKSNNDSSFIFTNSDPELVKLFLGLLRNSFILDEDKFRVVLHLHEYHDEQKQLRFWSKVTNIPLTQFVKSYCKPHTGKRIRDNYPGCASIRYHDVEVSRKVQAIARKTMRHFGSIS